MYVFFIFFTKEKSNLLYVELAKVEISEGKKPGIIALIIAIPLTLYLV
jgi:hypothetical protein